MIIDACAHLGPYPFRALRDTTALRMIARMDRLGIERAIVDSIPAVFYRDGHRGNAALHAEITRHRERLIPLAVINPTYADWEHCLDEAVQDWGMKGVALYPDYHGYRLADEPGRKALERIAARNVPVVLTQRLEDRREQHAWDRAEDMTEPELLATAKAHPSLRFHLRNWSLSNGRRLGDAGLKSRCLIDFARIGVLYTKEVPGLIETLGVEALAFGTHAPFDYAGPSLVKLANLETLPKADHERIAGRNAAAFYGLKV